MDSFKIYETGRHHLEEAYQAFLDDTNEGKPSNVLRYVFINEAIETVEDNPNPDSVAQSLMLSSLIGERTRVRTLVTVQTIRV